MKDLPNKVGIDSYKGVRDFYPEDMAIQNYIFDTWKKVAKEAGYVEYGASILEYADLYKAKGERNEEIVNDQMYTFTDKGDREVALRPEMTPTLARMIAARRKGLKLPLRWFSIPNCFRYERPQRGRRREHWQLNCDIMGLAGIEAEVEIISLTYKIMKAFGAQDSDFSIRISSRKALPEGTDMETVRKIDRGEDVDIKIEETEEIKTLLEKLKESGISNAEFDPKIARGFDYYTGIVFEVFDTNPENKRSLFGGGRYDNLLEMFGVEPLPTVGFGMGDITIRDFLETHNLPTTKNA
jgi:histidyl-tRNA synthetase